MAAALVLGAGVAAQGTDSLRLEVAAVLRGIPGDAIAPDLRQAQKLAGMGGESLAALFEILSAGELPRTEGARGKPERLGRARSETIVEAFRRAPAEVVRTCLREQASPSSALEERRAALRLYAVVGDSEDLVAVMRLSDENDAPALTEEFRESFARILSRDPDSNRALSGIVRRVPRALSTSLARAVGDAGSREGLLPLVVLADLQEELAATALQEIARIASRNDAPFPVEVVDRARRFLHSDDAAVMDAAIGAVGSLEDAGAIDELIERLASGSSASRSACHRALGRISGESFSSAREMWLTWWEAERSWYEERAPGLLESLTSEAPVEVIAALQDIVSHRAFRHQLAPEVAGLVHHDDVRIGRLACLALGQLGSAAAIPVLENALRDDATADQAQVALLSIRSSDRSGS